MREMETDRELERFRDRRSQQERRAFQREIAQDSEWGAKEAYLIPRAYVGLVIEQQPHHLHMARAGGQVQAGPSALRGGASGGSGQRGRPGTAVDGGIGDESASRDSDGPYAVALPAVTRTRQQAPPTAAGLRRQSAGLQGAV